MSLLKINGRTRFFARINEVRSLRPGHYVAIADHGTFHIEGGRPAGGTSRDWFVEYADGSRSWGGKHINATSLLDALHLIENT